jgi:hypothetical protein
MRVTTMRTDLRGGSWVNVFPSEMRDGDVYAERGQLVLKHRNVNEMTWVLIFCPHPDFHCGEDGDYCEEHWPHNAPMRLFRPDAES